MKTKMISLTLAAVLGVVGASSAFAQNLNYDSNAWIEQAIAGKSQTAQSKGIANAVSQAANDGAAPCQTPCH